MVAWNKAQESGLQTETFMLLLHKLGFHLAADVGKCFPRIPHFWSADHLYQLALKVGPIKKEDLKMDLSTLETASSSSSITNEQPQDITDVVMTKVPGLGEDQVTSSVSSPISTKANTSGSEPDGLQSLASLCPDPMMMPSSVIAPPSTEFSSFAM